MKTEEETRFKKKGTQHKKKKAKEIPNMIEKEVRKSEESLLGEINRLPNIYESSKRIFT